MKPTRRGVIAALAAFLGSFAPFGAVVGFSQQKRSLLQISAMGGQPLAQISEDGGEIDLFLLDGREWIEPTEEAIDKWKQDLAALPRDGFVTILKPQGHYSEPVKPFELTVHYGSRSVKLTAEEIMDALERKP